MLHSLIPADVDTWRLAQVELLVSGLLHQVEESVLQDELHQINEWLLHVHALPEDFLAVYS